MLKGTGSGTISDIDGQYQLLFPANTNETAKLTFEDDGRQPISAEVGKGQNTYALKN